jgi:hypothetical protein
MFLARVRKENLGFAFYFLGVYLGLGLVKLPLELLSLLQGIGCS